MREYIMRELGYPGMIKQEIVGELVRCKDCKHRSKGSGVERSDGTRLYTCRPSRYQRKLVPLDGYCWKGERREDE